jgi:hypothetical protein
MNQTCFGCVDGDRDTFDGLIAFIPAGVVLLYTYPLARVRVPYLLSAVGMSLILSNNSTIHSDC